MFNYLKNNAEFCLWRYEDRDGRKTKVPYNPNDPQSMAAVNKSYTFASYDEAKAALEAHPEMSGIGVRVNSNPLGNHVSAIDIDHCVENGQLSAMAQEIVKIMDSPAEFSPSGTGVHIYFCSNKVEFDGYLKNNREIGLEVYISGTTEKYLTFTENHIDGTPREIVGDRTDQVKEIMEKYMKKNNTNNTNEETVSVAVQPTVSCQDKEILAMASTAANAEKFNALWHGDITGYDSQSEADAALCMMLAFWTCKNAEMMDSLFRHSGLYRKKWDEYHGNGMTYGQMTIQNSINACSEVYTPSHPVFDCSKEELDKLRILSPWNFVGCDIGNAQLFMDFYKDKLRYVKDKGCWYYFDGTIWNCDIEMLCTRRLCMHLAQLLMALAKEEKDPTVEDLHKKIALKWDWNKTRETIIKDAKSNCPLKMADFDKDPMVLNLPNLTLNLATGEVHPHRAEDYLTRMAGACYDPNARNPRWDRFITEIMKPATDEYPNDTAEKARFLQKAFGYALTGLTNQECLFILYGKTTRNGKSTLVETVKRVMGTYAATANPQTVGSGIRRDGSAPSEDLARLSGVRFVSMSEPRKDLKFDGGRLKAMTGGDKITARNIQERSFEYMPQFKLFLNCNYQPQVDDVTLFRSGRLKTIPFEQHFDEETQDRCLKSQFCEANNLSAVLNWAIEGYHLFNAEGLHAPRAVQAAIDEYDHNNDTLALFTEECLTEKKGNKIKTSEFYQTYKDWCYNRGETPIPSREVKATLSERGLITRGRPTAGGENTSVVLNYDFQTPRRSDSLVG